MSHFTSVGVQIKDIEALREALSQMGLKLEHNQPCRYYSGAPIKENVVKLPGPYDLSIEQRKNGTYDLSADLWNGHVEKTIGQSGEILMRNYAIEKVKMEAKKKGYSVRKWGEDKFQIIDPTDASGGYLEVKIDKRGNTKFKAVGFSGSDCMRFASIEDALGVTNRKVTSEYYYQNDAEMIKQKEWQ